MSDRVRIGDAGAGPLQRLKDLSVEEQECLILQRTGKSKTSVARLIAQIEARHGIHGLSAQRWSDFAKWFAERQSIQEANASVQNLRALSTDLLTPDDVHQFCVDLLRITGMRDGDIKTLKFVTQEIRKVMALSHSREKWQEDQREKIEAGLDAVFQDIKSDAVAVELFEKIKERIRPKQQ
jgi:hypothetical protein